MQLRAVGVRKCNAVPTRDAVALNPHPFRQLNSFRAAPRC